MHFKKANRLTKLSFFPGDYESERDAFQSNIFPQIDFLSNEI